MNTYLIPVSDEIDVEILTVNALSFSEAEDKFIKKLCIRYNWDKEQLDWDEFCTFIENNTSVGIGNIQELSEFEWID